MNTQNTQQIETVATIAQAPAQPPQKLFGYFSTQQLFIFLLMGAALIWISWEGGSVKSGSTKANMKARAKWAGKKEILAARKLAVKQLNGRQRKGACVYIIKPRTIEYPESVLKRRKVKKKDGTVGNSTWTPAPELGAIPKETPVKVKGEKHRFYSKFEEKHQRSETVWVPDTQRSVMVVGAPGSGKTFSAIDPMIRSVIEQGYPIILYDFKYPTQASTVAWYAEKLGYKINVFAPGYPESDILNLLDFLSGDPEIDSAYARQLANTLNKNFRIGQTGGGDQFFDSAGDQFTQAVTMLTKQMKFADVLMTSVIMSAPQLIDRLYPESSGVNPWIRQAFGQIFSVKDSEKTVSSIIGTASLNFGKIVMPKVLSACVGKTTLPLDLEGKQMIIFGLDRELRDVMGPILATAIHMMVNKNLFRKPPRKDPLYCVLDELPTIYLPQLTNWENESRSDGFNGIIGFQNKSQLEKIYGKEMALAIMGGAATKFIFNPGEVESAEYFSKFFGDEEIVRRNISKSGGGGKGGTSTSKSIEVGTRKLVSPEEFTCLIPGEAIFTNPQYANSEAAYYPRRIKFNLPPWEIDLAGKIEAGWPSVQEKLVKRASEFQRMPTQEDVLERMAEFDKCFPIPDEEGEESSAAPNAVDVLAGMF